MANRYWVGGTAAWDATAGSKWATTSGAAGGQPVPGTGDRVFFDAASGAVTVTVGVAISIQALDMAGFTGTLTVGANNVNLNGLAAITSFGDTSGVHTINMGSGTWTVTTVSGGGVIWNLTNASCTLNAETSTLVLNTFTGGLLGDARFGNKTYNIVSLNAGFWIFTTAGTFATLTLVAGTSIHITASQTLTLGAGTHTFTGTRAAPILISNTSVATAAPATISCSSGTVTLDWGVLNRIVGSGGATFTATNTVSYTTGTTGWTISGPSSGGAAGVIGG